jgi:hypothetical protein
MILNKDPRPAAVVRALKALHLNFIRRPPANTTWPNTLAEQLKTVSTALYNAIQEPHSKTLDANFDPEKIGLSVDIELMLLITAALFDAVVAMEQNAPHGNPEVMLFGITSFEYLAIGDIDPHNEELVFTQRLFTALINRHEQFEIDSAGYVIRVGDEKLARALTASLRELNATGISLEIAIVLEFALDLLRPFEYGLEWCTEVSSLYFEAACAWKARRVEREQEVIQNA